MLIPPEKSEVDGAEAAAVVVLDRLEISARVFMTNGP
jgi:hypothetical protein